MLDALIQSQAPGFSACAAGYVEAGEAEDLYQETLLRGLEQRERLLAAEIPGLTLPGSALTFIEIGPGEKGCSPLSA